MLEPCGHRTETLSTKMPSFYRWQMDEYCRFPLVIWNYQVPHRPSRAHLSCQSWCFSLFSYHQWIMRTNLNKRNHLKEKNNWGVLWGFSLVPSKITAEEELRNDSAASHQVEVPMSPMFTCSLWLRQSSEDEFQINVDPVVFLMLCSGKIFNF